MPPSSSVHGAVDLTGGPFCCCSFGRASGPQPIKILCSVQFRSIKMNLNCLIFVRVRLTRTALEGGGGGGGGFVRLLAWRGEKVEERQGNGSSGREGGMGQAACFPSRPIPPLSLLHVAMSLLKREGEEEKEGGGGEVMINLFPAHLPPSSPFSTWKRETGIERTRTSHERREKFSEVTTDVCIEKSNF